MLSVLLGPIRFLIALFTHRNERALQFHIQGLLNMMLSGFTIFGAGRLLVSLPSMYPNFFDGRLPEQVKALISDPEIDWYIAKGTLICMFVVAPLIYIFQRLMFHPYVKLWNFPSYDKSTFMNETIVMKEKGEGLRFYPKCTGLGNTLYRGLAWSGMTRKAFMFTDLTIGIEYVLNYLTRIFMVYAKLGRFGSQTDSRKNLYQFAINTSIACWLNMETGHVEFKNMRMCYNTSDVIEVKYCVIELDHDKQEFVRMFIEMEDGLGLREVKDDNPDTVEEPSAVMKIMGVLITHPHVHFWANGISQLINPKDPKAAWPLAQEASDLTNYVNQAATYGSASFIGNNTMVMANMLTHNMNQGLPIHHNPDRSNPDQGVHMNKVAKNSRIHQIRMSAREKLRKLHPEWPHEVITTILVATVLHTADHYMPDHLCSFGSQCKTLKFDYSFLRLGIYGLNNYHTRSVKCCQHLDDPVCRAIYESAMEYDPVFAKEIHMAVAS